MNLYNVAMQRPGGTADEEPRVAVIVASDMAGAEGLARSSYVREGYAGFVGEEITSDFPGPARVLGCSGQRSPWRS